MNRLVDINDASASVNCPQMKSSLDPEHQIVSLSLKGFSPSRSLNYRLVISRKAPTPVPVTVPVIGAVIAANRVG